MVKFQFFSEKAPPKAQESTAAAQNQGCSGFSAAC